MLLRLSTLIAMLLCASCASVPQLVPAPTPTASLDTLCIGLKPAIDDLALKLDNDAVPTDVVVAGAKVVTGFDAGCAAPQ